MPRLRRAAARQSLARDPAAVDAREKEQKCYHVKCTATDGCGTPFGLKELATVLPAAAFDGLQAKNAELAVHLRLPDAVKEHLAAAAASTGPQTTAQYETDVRAAFRRPDGTFRDEQGCRVKQCAECGFGPVLKIRCDDMAAHHGDVVRDRRTGVPVYRQDMSCGHCGHLNRSSWATWPDWTGERVIGAVPPVRRAEPAGRRSSRRTARRRLVRRRRVPESDRSASTISGPRSRPRGPPPARTRRRAATRASGAGGGGGGAGDGGAAAAARCRRRGAGGRRRRGRGAGAGGGSAAAGQRRRRRRAAAAAREARARRRRQAAAAAAAEEAAAARRPAVVRAAARAAADSRRRRRRPAEPTPGARPLAVGDLVRVRRAIDPPHYGWGGVTHESVGTLLSIGDPNRVTVDMPGRHNAWLAELQELEHAAPRELAVGDRVRVRRAVRVPRFGWGSVDHDSVGTLLSVDHSRPCAPIASPRRSASAATTARGTRRRRGARARRRRRGSAAAAASAGGGPRARCGVGDEYAQLVGMGFEGETSLEALVRAARNHRDAERRVAVAVQTLLGA